MSTMFTSIAPFQMSNKGKYLIRTHNERKVRRKILFRRGEPLTTHVLAAIKAWTENEKHHEQWVIIITMSNADERKKRY